ncbi:TM35B protein, partial [Atractosteus spatula]|nr:TM35B protein [Atractosteus spatula]
MAVLFTLIRVLLGLFFALTGAVKLTDKISEGVFRELRSQFVQFAEVFPLRVFGLKPEPDQYLLATGWTELVAGLLLAFGPRRLQELSNFTLTVVMMVALFTLLKLQEPPAVCCPAAVCLGLLLLLNLRGQGRQVKAKAE